MVDGILSLNTVQTAGYAPNRFDRLGMLVDTDGPRFHEYMLS
jgi:hypothetical protein